jgi:hypothetical protein
MRKIFAVLVLALPVLALLGVGLAQSSPNITTNITVPRDKISLSCTDDFFKTSRINFVLQDETYTQCKLSLPLALRERWPGRRSFYIIPRVALSLRANDKNGTGSWIPLEPLINLGSDPFHRVIDSKKYKTVELSATMGKLSDKAGTLKPEAVSAGGKISVCAAPVYRNETPCVTFDVTARFKVYLKN